MFLTGSQKDKTKGDRTRVHEQRSRNWQSQVRSKAHTPKKLCINVARPSFFLLFCFFTPFPFLFRSVPPAASQSQSHSQAAYIVLEHRRWCSDAFLGYISGKRGDCLKADRMWELRFTPTWRSHFNFNLVVTFRISRRMNNKALFLTSSLIGTRFTHMFSWQWIYFIFVEKNSFINFTYWKH